MIDALYPTDLLRVAVAVPVFTYAAYRDVLERRVRHRVWYPAAAVAAVCIAVDLVLRDPGTVALYTTGSLAVGALFGYGFYYLGTFGGADRYALVVIAALFPVYPVFLVLGEPMPRVVPDAPVFVLSVLGNTVVLGVVYPVKLAVENAARRTTRNPVLFLLAKNVDVDDLAGEHGRIIEGPDGVSVGRSGVLGGSEGITDVAFVHDYLEWHGVERLSDVDDLRLEEFLEDTAWETEDLERDEMELTALMERDAVWISPGIPFIVPMLAGLLVALTYGDLLYAGMEALLT